MSTLAHERHLWRVEATFADGRTLWKCPACGLRSTDDGQEWQGDPDQAVDSDGNVAAGITVVLGMVLAAAGCFIAWANRPLSGWTILAAGMVGLGALLVYLVGTRSERR